MSITAIINPKSGSVPANARELLTGALEAHGGLAQVYAPAGDELESAIDDAFSNHSDLIIVWGGDGTISCALDRAKPDGPPVLPLPGGTMNILPTRLHGEAMSWDQCLQQALSMGQKRDLPCGVINNARRFYVGVILGDLARMAESREALREGRIASAATTALAEDALNLEADLAWTVEAAHPDKIMSAVLGVFLPEDGSAHLEIGGANPDGLLDLASIGLQSAVGD